MAAKNLKSTNINLTAKKPSRFYATLFITSTALLATPSFAGGLDTINMFAANIQMILTGVSLTVVTISIMWAGFKFLFKHADIAECGKILAGGLLIGGAGQLASYLLG